MKRAYSMLGRWLVVTTVGLTVNATAQMANELLFPDAPVAVVENEIITVSDVVAQTRVEERVLISQFRGAELEKKIEDLRRDVAVHLAEEELLHAEFKKKEFKVPQELLRRRMDTIIQAQAGGNREKFEQTLYAQGMTYGEFEQAVRKSAAIELLVNEFVRRPIHISPAEIRNYYLTHQAEFATPARVRLAIIQLKPDGRYEGKQNATLALLRSQLAEKADFGWLAKEYSEAETAAAKGDLGWMQESEVLTAFREVIKNLAPGEVAEPLRIADSVILLKLVEREKSQILPLDEALTQKIDNKLSDAAEKKRLAQYLATLKTKYHFRLIDDKIETPAKP